MKSIDERLADSNPVAHGYVPANYDQMVSRAMRQPRHIDAVWRMFRLRMAGSVAAVSALTVVGVSVLSGAGPALPVLGFSAAAHSTGSSSSQLGATKFDVAGPMIPYRPNYTFTGGSSFSTTGGSAPVFDLIVANDLATTLSSIATKLGITLATTPTADNSSTYYGVGGTGYSGNIENHGGSDSWDIYSTPNGVSGVTGTSGSTGSTGATGATGTTGASGATGATGATGASGSTGAIGTSGPVAATGSLATQAVSYVQALGDTAGAATETTSGGTTNIEVPLLINGSPSDFSDSFEFNGGGALVDAMGESFSLSTVATYPLISQVAGIDQINVQRYYFTGWVGYAPLGASSGGSSPSTTGLAPQSLTAPSTVNLTTMTTVATGTTGVTLTAGATGATGATGASGSTGVTGASGSSGSTGATGATGPTGPTTTTTMPSDVVNLTSVSMRYASYEMKGNVWMELPVFSYVGTVVNGGYQVTFDVVPLPSQYLNFATHDYPIPLGAR